MSKSIRSLAIVIISTLVSLWGITAVLAAPMSLGSPAVIAVTAPDSQRRGHARWLLDHAVQQAPRMGIATLLAFVFAHNAPSISLFTGRGFSAWGRLPLVAELDGVERDLVILGRRVG